MSGAADDEEPVTGREGPAEDEAFSGLPIPPNGSILLGKYKVEGVIGIGGMGMVIAARHEHLNERVALKMLLPRYAQLTETRKRFQREAQAAYKLRSEHVCRVLDAGDLEDGTPFIAMEFLKGEDLSALLRNKKRLPIPEAVDYILQACEALGEAHANEIVHRDLKPANLVVIKRKDGTRCLKVIDFGISKVATDTSSDLTNTFGYLGSPSYSAPEQFASTRALTASGDLWALGVILYEMVCGAAPFNFSSDGLAEMAAVIVHEPAIPMSARDPSIDRKFEQVVMKCLEKEPAQRFPRVRELAEALAPFASTPPDDVLGPLRRHQPGPLQVSPPRGAQTQGPRTDPTPGPALRSTVALESPPVRAPGSDHAVQAVQHAYSQPPAPMPSSPSLSPMPMFAGGQGRPPVTRYAVAADPITHAGPSSSPSTWLPVGLGLFVFFTALGGAFAYRVAHRPPPATDAPVVEAVAVPVATATGAAASDPTAAAAAGTAVVAAPTPSATAAPAAAPTPSVALSASTARAGSTARPPPIRTGTRPPPPAAGESGPKILQNRDGKF